MSLLGDVAGAAIGAISGIYGSNVSNSAAFEMQANSIAAQKESMQNRHQWEVEDLRKAGLNPFCLLLIPPVVLLVVLLLVLQVLILLVP